MAILMPHADWRDPETVRVDIAMPDVVLVVTALGSHFTWTITAIQARHLHAQLNSLLGNAEGGAL